MLLCVNHGVFYEFIKADEFFDNQPKRICLADVTVGVNYVIILNTTAGLWGYNIGDTIKFVSTNQIQAIYHLSQSIRFKQSINLNLFPPIRLK